MRRKLALLDWTMLLLAPLVLGFASLFTKTNVSYDQEWLMAIGSVAGERNTATGTSATSLTRSGATWTTDQWKYYVVVTTTTGRYGIITGNSATVLTVDQWYDPQSPGGAAGTTPGATENYVILNTCMGAMFMGLTANATAVAAGDTTLPSEITTAGGGLIRKICTLAHTASATTGTASAVFTANGSDSLPVTIAKMGLSNSIKSTTNNLLQTVLNATATLSTSGDQLTVTDTITL